MRKYTAFTGALTITALSLGTMLGGITPAAAGPDDGKIVTTKGHVDAPKTFWKNDIFTLKNESNYRGQGPEAVDLEKTVNWVGKGWGGSVFSKANQYIFTSTGSEALGFLGGADQHFYMAPQHTSFNHDPIWAGFGADSDIPVEKFRDGSFALDILSVDGPGIMELFSYSDYRDVPSVLRMLSSQEQGLQSYLLAQGTHTHNNTVFSKPGRYEVTYRTVARSADGTQSIASKPTVLVWQVGGQKPISGEGTPTGISTEDRYNAAPVGNLEDAGYSITLAPHEGREQDGDDKLTDITFTSTSVQEGTLTLYINGYFLTDLEVTGGKAVWPEMLGSEDSTLQAVFTPAEGQEGARWLSPELYYSFGQEDWVDSSDGEGSWPQKVRDARNTSLTQGFYTPTSGGYTAKLSPAPAHMPDHALLEVTFDDPNFRGFVRGGLYEARGEEYPTAKFEVNVVDGVARQYIRASQYSNNTFPKVEVIPHPDMNALRSSLELDGSYESGKSVHTGSGTMTITDAPVVQPPAPSPSPEPSLSPVPSPSAPVAPSPTPSNPSQPAPSPSQPSSPAPTASPSVSASPTAQPTAGKKCYYPAYANRLILDKGHVDLQATLKGQDLGISLKDDTGLIDAGSTQRSVNDVVFTVSNRAKHQRNAQMMDPQLDFIGPEGSVFYGLPQTQMPGIIWPGYSTEKVNFEALDGPVTLHLEPKSMPEDARFGLYEEGLNSLTVQMSSAGEDTSHDIPFATHAHANWVFTKAGHYTFDAYYTATLKDGTKVKSPVEVLAFAVGDAAVKDCEQAADDDASVSPTAQPSAQPSSSQVAPPVVNYSPGAPGSSQVPGPSASASPQTSDLGGSGHAGGSNGQAGSGKKNLAHTGFAAPLLATIGASALGAGALVVAMRRRNQKN